MLESRWFFVRSGLIRSGVKEQQWALHAALSSSCLLYLNPPHHPTTQTQTKNQQAASAHNPTTDC